jgi:hypothetical protein
MRNSIVLTGLSETCPVIVSSWTQFGARYYGADVIWLVRQSFAAAFWKAARKTSQPAPLR